MGLVLVLVFPSLHTLNVLLQCKATPLLKAAEFGRVEALEAMISRGADVNARDRVRFGHCFLIIVNEAPLVDNYIYICVILRVEPQRWRLRVAKCRGSRWRNTSSTIMASMSMLRMR